MRSSTTAVHDEINWRGDRAVTAARLIAEETAVALSYNGSTHAVMMATPADLSDFGLGFTLTEGLVDRVSDIVSIEVVQSDLGVEVQMWLKGDRAAALAARRRSMSGPVGCGLCGLESLEQARRKPARVAGGGRFCAIDVVEAMRALAPLQVLNQQTRSVHAAALWQPASGIALIREDVGRHNALDKLVGAITAGGLLATEGAIILTSRVSVEMVQKAATAGTPVVIAVSAPTTLAIQAADEAGITLIAIARADGFSVFTHSHRVILPKETLHRAAS
ncbi:FdhD protein [Bradyrhizobium elkanii]|uniref:formate dehydrogenase accessory sulfurtransferase FdhD n=1 Tax=Bradyrhizobium elkanii TaxID=29448 RepID=UPI002226B045|nr:formate dehydrogenase accessory sulfurtransferase FdhD [Bradyrhizobium elkanii]MCW2124933.1 FdhD protein [Bradyrhizobium elkanii]MCW2171679.1 FdhD protein [Bradyrhizobium elkanii]